MQVHFFPDGSFVIHRIKIEQTKPSYSAWFAPTGRLIDAEMRRSDGKTSSVPLQRYTGIAQDLQIIGDRYVGLQ